MSLEQEIASVLNRASRENASNTPDYILAAFLLKCLEAAEVLIKTRETWYGEAKKPGMLYVEPLAPPAKNT